MKMMKMMTMMMVMMVASVSAGPLPPVNSSHLLKATEGNPTRSEFHQQVNGTEDDVMRFFPPNLTMNEFSTFTRNDRPCVLATCLTANLASSLQGGDETAGGLTTDPFGNGKK